MIPNVDSTWSSKSCCKNVAQKCTKVADIKLLQATPGFRTRDLAANSRKQGLGLVLEEGRRTSGSSRIKIFWGLIYKYVGFRLHCSTKSFWLRQFLLQLLAYFERKSQGFNTMFYPHGKSKYSFWQWSLNSYLLIKKYYDLWTITCWSKVDCFPHNLLRNLC